MPNELAKKQRCLCLRNGVEIWVDEDKAEQVEQVLDSASRGDMIRIEGRTVNRTDITGFLFPEDMEIMRRQWNGQWQCKWGRWHKRYSECDCPQQVTEDSRKGLERYN